jgi:hypothetical protein
MTPRRPTQATVRRIALALPETVERSHFDRPDFRVRNKIFATLPKDPHFAVVKSRPANVDALVAADPATFSDEWRGRWVGIRLDRIAPSLLRELIMDAWQLVAKHRRS